MNDEKPRPDRKLPVTAEVGGEGGSYADATMQPETFSGPEGNPRAEPVVDDGAVVKHATEPPERRTR